MLGHSADPRVVYVLLDRLKNCPYPEGRLAAAGCLSSFDRPDGLNLALAALRRRAPPNGDRHDEAIGEQAVACWACGTIGDAQALPDLRSLLQSSSDMQVRLAAAGAILKILTRGSGDQARSRM